ncbi:heterokaryon incompatibility protein-domain-containing protein [Fusarium sp. MPI-SDFR-AT-0072]|nr:heterokaryon incompatibility protein-domain-containing protein [Fusarium sp. MPI-SDFR-AT-0072]
MSSNSNSHPRPDIMEFKYTEKLNNEHFRIFKLEPGQKTDDLRGSLQTHPLSSPPQYEALSYVWGLPHRNKSMDCNGQEFKITDSLDIALRRLRLFDTSRFLWIDQICINQDSDDERSIQVGLMKSIYSQASMVHAWLGPIGLDEANSVKEVITTLAELKTFSSDTECFPEDEKLLEYNLPARSSPAWSRLNAMLGAAYFSRVWIIQELTVASKFELLWGDISMSQDDLNEFLYKTIVFAMATRDLSNDSPELHWSPVAMSLLSSSRQTESDLFELVCRAAPSHASDERDKIFALIGIAGKRTYGVLPDYKKPAAEVFADFARRVIVETGNLDILDYPDVRDPDILDCSPLWAPRWQADDKYGGFNGYHFKASRDTQALPKALSNFKVLELGGLQIDSVKHVRHRVKEVHEDVLAALEMIMDNIETFVERYELDLIKPILLTLMAGREVTYFFGMEHHERPKDDTFVNNFIALTVILLKDFCTTTDYSETIQRGVVGLMRTAIKASASATDGEPVLEGLDNFKALLRQGLETLYPEDPDIVSSDMDMIGRLSCDLLQGPISLVQCTSVSVNLNFFVTEKGYMGVGPRCMKPGDKVCILFGGSTPYIIRPTSPFEDSYLYMGPAYIHSIMDGEAIDAWEEKGPKDYKFQETQFKLL